MPIHPNILQLIASVLAVVYPFWPLMLLTAFAYRLRRPLAPMVIAWSFMLLCWLCARLIAMPALLHFINEPVNTALFLATGTLIVGLFILRKPLRLHI